LQPGSSYCAILLRRFAGLIALVAVFCAGCARAPEDSPPRAEVRVGRLICGGHLPLAVVERRFQSQLTTFRLTTVQNHDWNSLVEDLETGELAGTFILSPLALELIRDGLAAKIVLLADRNGNGFVLSNELESIEALGGRRSIIAVPHIYSQHHVLLHELLEQHGVTRADVTAVGMAPRDMINALRRREIDGFVVGEPEATRSVRLGVGWLAAVSPQIWRDHMDHVFLATDRFIAEHPDELQELVSALVRGGQFIEENPTEAAVLAQDYTGSEAAIFEEVLTTPGRIGYGDMLPVEDDIRLISQRLVQMGLWKSAPEDASVFIDTRFVRKALAQRSEARLD
jgi:NitT/TauT family transport system substrate-binding protein